jgi:hypothetical protein
LRCGRPRSPEVGSDVKGLKPKVAGGIEELDAWERQREELVAELVPAMESRGYETVGRRQ